MNIEDLIFKLTAIEILQGTGGKTNNIITVDNKRSIVRITDLYLIL